MPRYSTSYHEPFHFSGCQPFVCPQGLLQLGYPFRLPGSVGIWSTSSDGWQSTRSSWIYHGQKLAADAGEKRNADHVGWSIH